MTPPQSSLGLIQANWPAPAHIHAYVTTRQANNMALHVDDHPETVLHNRTQLTNQLNLTQPICWLTQQHTTQVVKAECWQPPPIADALWSDQAGLACAVMTADCLPVLFTDVSGQQVAAAHAGWRGLLAGVLENTVATMAAPPHQLMAWLGPAISQAAFEVDDSVRTAFVAQNNKTAQAFIFSNKILLFCTFKCSIIECFLITIKILIKFINFGFCLFNHVLGFIKIKFSSIKLSSKIFFYIIFS